SALPGGPLGLVVVHDDDGEIGRADRVEVVLLGRQVAVAEALLDPGGGSKRRQATHAGASQGLLERGRWPATRAPRPRRQPDLRVWRARGDSNAQPSDP